MNAKLDGRDRQKLDQYLTSVREIEQRIENSTRLPVKNPDVDAPAGIPDSYAEHVALMFDMLALAFQTDSTRVATLLIWRVKAATAASLTSASPRATTISRITRTARRSSRR